MMMPSTPQSISLRMSASAFTVHGITCRPRRWAPLTALSSMLLKFGAQTLPPAAFTMCATDG